jgi:glucose/arabinose dehydrogenase
MRPAVAMMACAITAGCAATVTDTTATRDAGVDATAIDRAEAAPDLAEIPDGPTFCEVTAPNVPAGARVPEGFCLRRFARVAMPRVLAFAPNGDLFVSSPGLVSQGGTGPGLGAIVVLPDDDRDGLADEALRFLDGLPSVHGLAFDAASLLYTIDAGVFRAPYASGDRRARAPFAAHPRVADLRASLRWTHTLARAASGEVYVSVGQYDVPDCAGRDPRGGGIFRVAESAPSVVAGLRNPLYTRCAAWGACYAMELTHDAWDILGGTEKLLEIRAGDDYLDPCCVDRGLPVPGVANDCRTVPEPVLRIPKHDTPLGFDWAPAGWPAPYGGGLFVAQHGGFGSWARAGVWWSATDPASHRPTGALAPFVEGWGRDAAVEGRPADAVFAPDGRLFFADDQDGAVYWIAPTTLRVPSPR